MYGAVKSIVGKQAVVTIIGDDPKTFQAAMVEYSREQKATKQEVSCYGIYYIQSMYYNKFDNVLLQNAFTQLVTAGLSGFLTNR